MNSIYIKGNFEKTNEHIYNKNVVKCDVYKAKAGRGVIYLMDIKNFTYTASFGANSDLSYTGSFFGDKDVKTVQDAMRKLKTINFNK